MLLNALPFVCVFVLSRAVSAVQLFTNATIPSNLTVACSEALLADVNCSPIVASLTSGQYYTVDDLDLVCTDNCTSALSSFESDAVSACTDEIWMGFNNETFPVEVIPNLLRYQYNLTCMTDSGRYCNNVAALSAYAAGQDVDSAITGNVTSNTTDPCDICFIKNLQFQAGSPYYDGYLLQDYSIYESKTSSCSITGYPVTTTTFDWQTTTTASTASASATSAACTGTSYAVQSNDTCYSISKSQGIGTAWLLADNDLSAYCYDFPTNGTLCLINTCDTYTVQTNDTCTLIASAYDVTEAQLKSWNPIINSGCNNLDRLVGSQICIEVPGTKYTAPTTAVVAATTASTAAAVPTSLANGTNTDCGEYYYAVSGDYCNLITIKFGISLADFIFLNPSINENCTNLYANESYCVEAVGDINTYSGRAGYTTAPLTSAASTTTGSTATETLPDATYTTPATNTTTLPLASGTRADCASYFDGSAFSSLNVSTAIFGSVCGFAAAVFSIDTDDLGFWNSGLGNASLSTCTFNASYRYCSKWYDGDTPAVASATASDLPIRTGASDNCTEYVSVVDGWTCEDLLSYYDLTIAQFYSYNPAVESDCSGLWTDYQYCIRTPDYVDTFSNTTTSASATVTAASTSFVASSTGSAPSPTLSGQPSDCIEWYEVETGDSCSSVESEYDITSAEFLEWNPSVSSDCDTNFWSGYYYCVGIADNSTTATPTTTQTPVTETATSSTTSSIAAPTNTQANSIPSDCDEFAEAQSGDYCSLFASRNNVTLTDLYDWNAILGDDGEDCDTEMWADYYYCVGVSDD